MVNQPQTAPHAPLQEPTPRPTPPKPPVPPPRVASSQQHAPASASFPVPPSRPRSLTPQEIIAHQAAVIDAQMRTLRAQTVLINAYQDLLTLTQEP